ncbi:alpha/beta hydrolase fold protein [Crinalium epipsammum PCC 9333]|uniref:Alpha/beta hydrolase fold protein n=1 Tax=Crinalium epipsammum PCC 9333 TaxID=1173022 RepID=K9W1H4_9CYAN|nr:alpha/beta hydrolase [Crinalium epipsammum]AFZ14046.1 alpha/beta hydrolase fold protein [Crinalium epipsammum PCC 9333]
MVLMPLTFLMVWLAGLLSIGILGGGVYILYEWYEGDLVGYSYLLGGVALVLWSFGGRFIIPLLFHRPGNDEPSFMRTGSVQRIQRPDGSELHVEFYGPEDGQPIIFSHGWGPNSTVWYYAKKQLSDRFRVIVWDLPGLGKSKRPKNNDYSLEKYARDLEAVVSIAGDKPVILLGHSMGGMITLTFSRLFPELLGSRVAGLILVDTSYINPVKTCIFNGLVTALQKPVLEPILYLTIFLSPIFWAMTWLSYFNGSLYISVELSGFTGKETRGQLNFAALLSALGEPGVLARGTLAMFKLEETATLKNINVPVLVVTGKSDIAVVPETSARMQAEIPNAELVTLKPGGHMALMERNEQFSEAVSSFSSAIASKA